MGNWARLMRAACLVICASTASCLRTTAFQCANDEGCYPGRCEPTMYCSFTDGECTSGRRYGELSGPYANKCVGEEMMGDGGVDMPDTPDGMSSVCPSDYMTLPNAGTHKYKRIGNAAQWSTQRSRCAADAAGGATYLAVPDVQAESTAIATLGAANTWIGINDTAMEMNYVTVLGGAATFLPWDTGAGEPDDTGTGGSNAQDCVAAVNISGLFMDERCGTSMVAVCECNGP